MAKMVDPKTYARNVLKSAGYITAATIGGINPSFSQYVVDNANSVKEMYHQVRDYKNTIRNKVNSVLGETGYEDLKTIKGNIMDDLRTGKFYNPEREAQNANSLMVKMGFVSFDFDDTDFDVDEDVGEKVANDATTASSINTLVDKISNVQKSTSATSAKSIIKGGRANTAAMIAHNEKMFGQVNSSLANIHSSIINLHKDLATPLNNHITNSANFYGVATTELSKQTALLENIQGMLADRFRPTGPNAGKKHGSSNNAWKTIMGGGLPNFSAWGQHAKNKLLSDTGLDMLLGLDPEMIQMLLQTGISSPIAMILSGIGANRIRNSAIGKGLNRTIGTLKGGFNHMAVRISQYARKHSTDFTLPALLSNLFDIMPSGKAKMNFGNYNKGRQDWTGMDSKALREVIPTQLAQILSAITGRPPKLFDYKTGRFMTSSQIKDEFNRTRNAAIGSSSSDLKGEILDEFIEQDKRANRGTNTPDLTYNSKAVRNLSKTYDTLVSMLSIKNVSVSNFRSANELISFCRRQRWIGNDLANGGRDYIFDEKSLRRLARIIYSGSIPGVQGRFEGAIIGGQMINTDMINNAGDTTYGMLHNGSDLNEEGPVSAVGSAISGILENKDKYGNDVYFYLHSYYESLKTIVDRASAGLGTGNRRATNTRSRSEGPTSTNTRRERTRSRTTHIHSVVSSGAASSSSDDDSISDDERYLYNASTQEYEAPRTSPTSTNTRERREKESIFTKIFNKTNAFLDDLFYGNSDSGIRAKIRDHGGILGMIKDIPQTIADASKALMDKLKEFAKDKWNKFKESDFGKQYFSNMKNSVKDFFAKDTWQDFKSTAGSAIGFMTGKVPSWAAQVSGSRRGGVVQKSGMASVSEGEIIIPADQNPNYTGHMGNAARDSIERTNYKKWLASGGNEDDFYGFFRRGSKSGIKKQNKKKKNQKKSEAWEDFTPEEIEKIDELYNNGYTAHEISKEINKPHDQVQRYVDKKSAKGNLGQKARHAREKVEQVKDSKAGQYVEKLFKDATGKVDAAISHLFGESDTYSNAKKYADEAKNVAKENLPKTFADATIGGLIGAAVTGSGIGLLGGMVIGAGSSIIKRSDVISKALFGEEDVEGNYSGGIIPDKVTKFIKKRLPKVAKSAAIGSVLGTLGFAPGGIFGGMAIGAGLELVSTTDTFKDIMFGKPNVHNQRTGGIMGSIRDHVVTPLIDFTRGGLTKIGDYIKENFLKPIGSLFDPIKDWVKGKGMKMMDGIVDAAKATVKRTVGERFNALFAPLAKRAGAVGKWALGAAGKVASAPFWLAGKMGEGLAAHNIRAGYSSKSAKERMDLEGTKMGVTGLFGRKLKNTGYTKWASTASDEDIQAAAHYVSGANSLNSSIIRKRQDLADMITASLRNGGNMDPKIVKQIKKLFNTDKVRKDNDFSDVIKVVQKLPEEVMGSKTKEAVLSKIEEYRNSIDSDNNKLKTFDSDQNDFFNRIGLTDAKSRKKFTKEARIQAKLDAAGIRKATGASEAEAIAKAKEKDEAAKLLKDQEKDSPIDAKRNYLLSSILNVASGIARHIGVGDHEIPKNSGGNKFTSGVPGVSVPSMRQSGTSVNEGGEAPEGTIKTEFVDGEPVQFIYRSGQWEKNMADSGTKTAVENAEEDRKTRNSFYNAWVGGGILGSLKGLFGSNDGEKKETLWDKIKGFFGGAFNTVVNTVNGAVPSLAALIPGIVTSAISAFMLSKYGEKSAGTDKDSGMNADTDPEERKKEVEGWTGIWGLIKKSGLGIDAIENTIRGRKTTTYDSDDFVTPYMTDRYTGRMVKNVILGMNPKMANAATKVASNTIGKIPIVGKALSGGLNLSTKASTIATRLGTGIKSGINNIKNLSGKIANSKIGQTVAEKVTNVGGNLMKKAGDFASKAKDVGTKIFAGVSDKSPTVKKIAGVASDVVTKIKSVISTIFEALVSKLGLKSVDKKVLDKVSEETAETVVKKGSQKLSTLMAKAVVFVQIALIANAVIEGFQDTKAKVILGILDEPTMMQKILAAACNGLNEAIPGIGGIIPTEVLFSIMFTALEALGCKFDTLIEQRKKAKAIVAEYNEANGTTYNVEEYIHNYLGEYTFQENIVRGVKSGFNAVKNTVSSGFDKFKSFFTGGKSDEETGSGSRTNDAKLISMGDVNSNYTRLNGSASSTKAGASTSPVINAVKSGSSSVNTFGTYSASGTHATQKGNYRVFGGSTIDQNGCGPASAATVLRAYGKNVSVNDAATYAESGGYVAGASGVENAKGTKASYFNDILGRNGIKTSYTDDKSKIKAAVSSGNPTILLGQDKGNSSKSNSPFGPNPHYVVTRGTDKNGNVVVDDPELNGTALYKRDILNKAKLGVATAGASGVSGLLSSAFSGLTSNVSKKLGDSAAGKVWNFIFGGNESSSEDESTSVDAVTGAAIDANSVLGGPGTVTYGKNNLFAIVTSAPNSSDPNIKCFNNSANGGVSRCISGKPTDEICNVLSNCVGWASGRFNQIYNILMNTNNQMKFQFACNAENFIEKAREFGLSVGTTPQIGAIMVWQKGNTLGNSDGAGHVAIVERVDSADKVYTSESGWGNSKKMWNKTRTKGTGNWGSSGAYKFRGFIYNPAVSAKLNAGSTTTTNSLSATESKTTIWKYLKNKGLTDYAISGAMGCWQAESNNKADRVEGDYLRSYPGHSTVLASKKSISDYTSGKLFNAYANSNISINKNAYKGTDGYYYPGIGLAQWTGPRAEKLINYGEQNGKNFRNLDTQLDFFWSEFQNRAGLKDKMNSATSPQDATTKFLDGFEMYDGWHNTSTGRKQNSERQGHAQSIYNTYAGTGSGAKPVTYDFTNPNNDPFGTGSSVPTIETRRARTVSGSASKLRENEDQLNQILNYIKIIAENTTSNKLLGTLVELQNDTVSLLTKVSSKNANDANSTASEDYAKSIESDIAKMRAKLDSISQTL